MLITIKIGAIIVVVSFYLAAKSINENRFTWAISGLVGYLLTFAIAMMLIGEPLVSMILGLITSYFARKIMLRTTTKDKEKLAE